MHRPALIKKQLLLRSRLLSVLQDAPRLTHIRAPAGFGKSTLLDQYEDMLRERGDLFTRINLVKSLPGNHIAETIGAGQTQLSSDMLQSLLTADGQIATLIIDDADHVSASSEMTALLATIIALPAKLRVVLASRRELDVPLADHVLDTELPSDVPAAPAGLVATSITNSSALLTWTAVEGADIYKVYRRPAGGSDADYALVGSSTVAQVTTKAIEKFKMTNEKPENFRIKDVIEGKGAQIGSFSYAPYI